ncbi:unnamed protein product [Larinioides sclopetarius]|uniref:Uncharacterized protein n=1 Tax=Larinioides sclopetarius TaxID=280406 RepID=A0AAV2AWM8_9ARAC
MCAQKNFPENLV